MTHPWARIADANLNRAREGLRMLEDLARFALDDAALATRLKELRHALTEAARGLAEASGLDRAMLLAWRDTPGDVGTRVKTVPELKRGGCEQVAAAAAARASEAIRCLEECAKALNAPAAALDFERLRYTLYDAERALAPALPGSRARQWRLCVLVTESLCTHHPWDRVAELAVEGGADCLQLREKNLGDRELLDRARRLVAIARAGRASSIVNDRPDLALLAGADGVHVGKDDLSPDQIRRLWGDRLIIGVSTNRLDAARAAIRAGADYCGVGPMFPSTTKPGVPLAGPEYLARYLADPLCGTRPHLAIGGITAERVADLIRVGCRGIAVSGAVCSSPDPRATVAELVSLLAATG